MQKKWSEETENDKSQSMGCDVHCSSYDLLYMFQSKMSHNFYYVLLTKFQEKNPNFVERGICYRNVCEFCE